MNRSFIMAAGLATLTLAPLGARAAEPPKGKTYHMRGSRGWIKYTVKERGVGGSGAVAVEVWYRKGAGPWTLYDVDKKLTGKMIFKTSGEGIFDFVTVAVDKVGNREKEPAEFKADAPIEFRLIVDHSKPVVTARKVSPTGDLAPAGGKVEYSWAAGDTYLKVNSVELQVKFAKDKAWRVVEQGLKPTGRKTFALPEVNNGVAEVRFVARDLAGNRGYGLAGQVKFDRLPPVGTVTGPDRATSLSVSVRYKVVDQGPAGLAEVTLWITDNGGRSWVKTKEKPSIKDASVKITLPRPGRYGLSISAKDVAGNEMRPPRRGTKPQMGILTDTSAPRLTVVNTGDIEGRAFSSRAGAEKIEVRWKATDDNLSATPVRIEFSSDGGGKWTVVDKDLPNDKKPRDGSHTGSYRVGLPKVDSNRCLLRITVTDILGNKTVHTTRPFTVDNRAPESSASFEAIVDDDDDDAPDEKPGKEPGKVKVSPAVSAKPDVERLLAEAKHLFDRDMKKQAAEKAAEALKLDSESAAAHVMRGRALKGTDDSTAVQHLLKANRLAPETEGLHVDLAELSFAVGMTLRGRNKRADAEKHLGQAVKSYGVVLGKGKVTARKHYNLGLAMVRLAQVQDRPQATRKRAERELLRAIKMARRDRGLQAAGYWWLAILMEDSRDYRTARKLWEKAATLYGRRTSLGKQALEKAKRAARRR